MATLGAIYRRAATTENTSATNVKRTMVVRSLPSMSDMSILLPSSGVVALLLSEAEGVEADEGVLDVVV
jgi:hypothetical protein